MGPIADPTQLQVEDSGQGFAPDMIVRLEMECPTCKSVLARCLGKNCRDGLVLTEHGEALLTFLRRWARA